MTVTVFDRGRNARPGTSSIDPPARARSFRRERVKECYHLAMEYRRAFARAVRQQPWWQWLAVIMFDLFNLSAADYLRLWRGLGLTAKDVLWTSALFLTALLIYRIGADAWRELHEQNAELEVRTKPRLQIAFDPDKYPTCLQQNEWQDPDGTRVVDRLFRVGIINISVAETVDDVEVMLAELIGLESPQDTHFLPARLAGIGDARGVYIPNPPRHSLNPGATPTLFIDVAEKRSAGNGSEYINLRYASSQWPATLRPSNRYRLRILAKSRNAPEADAWFLMYADSEGVLHFEPGGSQL